MKYEKLEVEDIQASLDRTNEDLRETFENIKKANEKATHADKLTIVALITQSYALVINIIALILRLTH